MLVFGGVVALYLLLSYVLWKFLNNYIQPGDDPAQRRGLVQALGLILVGLAGAIGIYFTWRGQQHAREAQEGNQEDTQDQLKLAREQLKHAQEVQKHNQENTQEELNLTRQGQTTERFTQAVQQLGDDKLEIKLGGIYSLERTAQEEKHYHWPAMEVLTAYVRRHAARHAARKPDEEPEDSKLFKPDVQASVHPEPDIQAILDVIGRRSEHHRTDKRVETGTIDLSNTNLRGATLKGAYLRRANLKGADLWQAELSDANLEEAHLSGVNLSKAKLWQAHLSDANLEEAHLSDAILDGAWLQGTKLVRANLREADLAGANLSDANLLGANLSDANLKRADLSGAHFIRTNLAGANLASVDLSGASFAGGNLAGANLGEANLAGANLRTTRGLTDEQLERAVGDQDTQLPDHLKPPAHWGGKTHEQVEGD